MPSATPQAQAASSAATSGNPPTGLSTADAVARVRPAVVHIQAEDGVGSGILYRPDGYIITNYHVVADARRLMVTVSDGRSWPAQVLGVLPDFDLAVLGSFPEG